MTLHEPRTWALVRREAVGTARTGLPPRRWRRRLSSVAFIGVVLLAVGLGARGTFGRGALGVLVTAELTLLLLLCRWFSVSVPGGRVPPRCGRDRSVTAVEPPGHAPRMN